MRGPCGVAGRLSSSLSFQALGVPAAVNPVSWQRKACWVQLPSHPVCTPSLCCHGLAFVCLQLTPNLVYTGWSLTGSHCPMILLKCEPWQGQNSCLSIQFQVRVSLTGFYLPIEMVPLLACPGRFTEVAIPIAWKNGADTRTDEPVVGCLLPHFPCYRGSSGQWGDSARCS